MKTIIYHCDICGKEFKHTELLFFFKDQQSPLESPILEKLDMCKSCYNEIRGSKCLEK